MTSLDSFGLSCLLMCAVGANAQGREAEAMRYLEQIPTDQLRRAEDLLAELRNRVYLRRQSGVDFDAEGRPQFTVRHQDICGIDTVSGAGVCVCAPDPALVAAAVLQPDHASLPEGR